MEKLCHCGKPLHYSQSSMRATVERFVAELGEYVTVRRGDRAWRVPRHYIALHGLKGKDLPNLGFEEVRAA